MILLSGDKSAIIIGVLVIAAIVVYVLVREKLNKNKANTGEDKRRVREILQETVSDMENYTPAYASWQITKYYGKRSETSYWYYAIAYNDDRMHVVQLDNSTGTIRGANSFTVEKSRVGMVNSFQGANWATFYDEDGEEIVTLMVEKENLRDDSFHPVNIIQPEEAAAFQAFVKKWMEDINTAKGITVTGKYGKPVKKK